MSLVAEAFLTPNGAFSNQLLLHPLTLQESLERLYELFPYPEQVQRDPLSLVREASPADREIVGLLSSALAYGRVEQFLPKIREILAKMQVRGGARAFVQHFEYAQERSWLKTFRYRMTSGDDLARFFTRLSGIMKEYGSIEQAFCERFAPTDSSIKHALQHFVGLLYEGTLPSRSYRHLFPSPELGSACKRWNLFLRWMVRKQAGVDPGGWTRIAPSHLIMPLDTHSHRLAFNLALTSRLDTSWKTAEEVTESLRKFCPQDPVRYDFVLCHMGMAGDCPSRRKDVVCLGCRIRPFCRWWSTK